MRSLNKLVFKIIITYEANFKAYYTESFTSLPKLIDLDYRIDLKQFNKKQVIGKFPLSMYFLENYVI